MKIRTKLLVTFLPLILIPVLFMGYLTVRNLRGISEEAENISTSTDQLKTAAGHATGNIDRIVEKRTRSDYEYIRHQAKSNIELASDYLSRYAETLAGSTLIESFLTGPTGAHKLLSFQLGMLFEKAISNYDLSEIAILDTEGKEVFRTAMETPTGAGDSAFDTEPLPNKTTDESASQWFVQQKNKTKSITQTIFTETDFPKPEAVLIFCCPLKYNKRTYDPVNGDIKGYLKIAIRMRSISKTIFSKVPSFQGEVVLTDLTGMIIAIRDDAFIGGTLETVFPELDEYVDVKETILNGQAVLHVLASKKEIRRSSEIVTTLAGSIRDRAVESEEMSSKVKRQIDNVRAQMFYITFLTVIIAIFMVAFVAKKFSAPITSLSEAAIWIASGNLKIKPEPGKAAASEIRLLADHLNIMRLNLKDQIENLDKIILERTRKLREANRMYRKAKDEAETANRIKSEFLANMSHEIRTPMNAIMGLIDLVYRTDPNSRQRHYLKKIRSSSCTLLGIIEDILDFSKIEAGKLELENIDLDLNEVLGNIVDMFGGKAAEKGLELIVSVETDVPCALRGDPLRTGQILLNLCANAVKFTETGEIFVRVGVVEKSVQHVKLIFKIRDTGIGIPSDKINSLFDSFTQADGATSRKYGGTGLGLAICKRLVELMGGQVHIKSEEGKGSQFSFTAVFDRQPEDREASYEIPDDIAGIRVLVTDDNATSGNVIRNMANTLGLDTTLANSGDEALYELKRSVAKNPFHLAIVDWKMPEADGIELISRIRHNPKLRELQLILMAEVGSDHAFEDARKHGIRVFLDKPVKRPTLFDAILEAFGKKERKRVKTLTPTDGLLPLRGARILLVEDNALNQQVALEIMENAGMAVDVAGNGKMAVEILFGGTRNAREEYDAVLMDVQMPIMNGYEATAAIREKENQFGLDKESRIPIIAMTAHALKEDKDRCLECGMNDYLSKPINSLKLLTVLAGWIKPSQERKTLVFSGKRSFPMTSQGAFEIRGPDLPSFPEGLPGIDIESALMRLGGNGKLLVKLIKEFHTDYAGAAKRIRDALYMGDLEVVRELSHTVKGLAGNFSAYELHYAALNLEMGIRQGNLKDLDNLMDNLETALSVMTESAERLIKKAEADQPKAPDSSEQNSFTDLAEAESVLGKLLRLMDNNNPEALVFLASLKMRFDSSPFWEMMAPLEKHLDKFDFKGGRKTLTDIAESLGIRLEFGR